MQTRARGVIAALFIIFLAFPAAAAPSAMDLFNAARRFLSRYTVGAFSRISPPGGKTTFTDDTTPVPAIDPRTKPTTTTP
jgi:hypothetical protein